MDQSRPVADTWVDGERLMLTFQRYEIFDTIHLVEL